MATLLPPPKRVKVYHGVPEPEPEAPKPSPNIVVQFVSEDDGKPLAPAVNLPSNVSREGLEALVNKLSTQVSLLAIELRSHSNPSDVRTMNQCRFRFTYCYLRMPHLLGHLQGSSFRNPLKQMFCRIQHRRSQRKMCSSSIVRHSQCFE
jgi:NLE (NUC135) domain